jgi:Ca2+-binding RTX toxin-like protein
MRTRSSAGRVWRKFVLSSTALAALLLGAAASASAGTLDQQQTSFNSDTGLVSTQSGAQTFTTGISGVLDQADLVLRKLGNAPAVTVEIRDTSAGEPGTTVLATGTIPSSAIGTVEAFVPVTFATPAPVTAGTLYALVAYSPGSGLDAVGWSYQDSGNPYPDGASFFTNDPIPPDGNWIEQSGGADQAFKTYVVPGPGGPGAGPGVSATCKGKQATLIGTNGNDAFSGTPGRDVMAGLGGNDRLSGLAGNDLICGGKGKDTLIGGKGKDKLYGQKGKDKLKGKAGKDLCVGGPGKDTAKKCEKTKKI